MEFASDRRTFLGTGGAAAVATALPLVRKEGVSPKEFGAAGDGTSNDLAAVLEAIAHALKTGLSIDGGEFEYGVAGDISISGRVGPYIERLRLKQLSPATGRNTLRFRDCQQIRIDSLSIHVGSSKRLGDMQNTTGLQVDGGSGHRIKDVTVTGNGKLTYVQFWRCTDSLFENIHVHDGEFEDFQEERVTQDGVPLGTIRVPDDVVQGIHLADCIDCNLVNPVVRNLLGNATYFNSANAVKHYRNFRTRGIAGGGNRNCTVLNPKVTNVEQAIDFSGAGSNWGNINVQVTGGQTRNCGSVGVKFANAPNGCRAIGHTAENCGMYGYLLTGQDRSARGIDNSFIGCEAINPGYNDVRKASDAGTQSHTGFHLLQGASGALIGSRLLNCRSIDRQGFYLAGDDSPWAVPGATRATMAEAWTGYTGSYRATFTTSNGAEAKTVTLTEGSTAVSWAGGLAGAIIHPFVSRPAMMQFGALCDAPYYAPSGKPNMIAGFESVGHIQSAEKGFQRYRCHLKGDGVQSIPNDRNTAILWETEVEDTLDMHASASNRSRITFARPGVYRVSGLLSFAESDTGYRGVQIQQGGTAQFTMPYAAVSGESTVTPFDVELTITAAGQYAEVFAEQTSGRAIDVDKAASFVIAEMVEAGRLR